MAELSPMPEPEARPGGGKGTMFVVGALAFVAAMVAFFPAARLFLAISIPIGLLCAVILFFVNKRPVKLDETENKRPLGL